jgi:hypothetical protein
LYTTLKSQATDVLNGIPNGATYEEILRDLKNQFEEERFGAAHRSQLKLRISPVNGSLTAPVPPA